MASITEVARLAGVSVATASRVVSAADYPVSAGTRARVLEAARVLDYVPNALARGLLKSRVPVVGVIVHDITDPYFAEVVRGVEDAAAASGYLVITSSSERDADRERSYVRLLRSMRAAAVVFAGSGLDDPVANEEMARHLAAMRADGAAVVHLSPHAGGEPDVGVDNAAGLAGMVAALAELGHRRIAFLAGPRSLFVARSRLEGYHRGLAAAGLDADDRLVVHTAFDREGGMLGVDMLLAGAAPFTAVCCANDLLALGALGRLTELGHAVPGDVSVAGFDDITIAALTAPALSTVCAPAARDGPPGLRARGPDPGGRHLWRGSVLPSRAASWRGTLDRRARAAAPAPLPDRPARQRRHRMSLDLRGIIPACVITFDADGRFDEAAYRRYLQWLLPQGPVALAINADTGEGPHLRPEEREQVLRAAVDEAGAVPVDRRPLGAIHGAGGRGGEAGPGRRRAALLVFPIPAYQGTPLDPAIPVAYHEAIARGCDLPLVAFQLQPALGGVIFSEEILRRIAAIDSVIALKEASFDARLYLQTRRMIERLERPIDLLTGNDNFILESFVMGAEGALIGFGTLATDLQVEMVREARAGRWDAARAIWERILPLEELVFGSPVRDYRSRTKVALRELGVIEETAVRPPLLPIAEAETGAIRATLAAAGLL